MVSMDFLLRNRGLCVARTRRVSYNPKTKLSAILRHAPPSYAAVHPNYRLRREGQIDALE